MCLLQYPLDVEFDESIKRNDLLYYTTYTSSNGFYTGDSSYAIAWMALGNRTGCDVQFVRAFAYMNGLPATVQATQYSPLRLRPKISPPPFLKPPVDHDYGKQWRVQPVLPLPAAELLESRWT